MMSTLMQKLLDIDIETIYVERLNAQSLFAATKLS
jgi:hypothetical protein